MKQRFKGIKIYLYFIKYKGNIKFIWLLLRNCAQVPVKDLKKNNISRFFLLVNNYPEN